MNKKHKTQIGKIIGRNRYLAHSITRLKMFTYWLLGYGTRKDLLRKLPPHSMGTELGVFKGEFTKHILKIVKPSKLHLVDAWWLQYGDYFGDWGVSTNYGKLTTHDAFEMTKKVVKKYDKNDAVEIHVANDIDCLTQFPDSYLDWAYLDTTHLFSQTLSELMILNEKVKANGLICGHDWFNDPNHLFYGVKKAVEKFCQEKSWELILLDKHSQWMIQRKDNGE